MSDSPPDLVRAIRVYRSLDRFLDVCFEWLEIEDHPRPIAMPFFLRGLQTFEGVPEVYPFAFGLLDALGPGLLREIGWVGPDRRPQFRAALGDIAYHSRELIIETWGWSAGLTWDHLHFLVQERRRTGCPTRRRRNAELMDEIERAVPSHLRYQLYMDPPPFSEIIPPEKKAQFERIVQFQIDQHLERLGDVPALCLTPRAEGEASRDPDADRVPESYVRRMNEKIEASPLCQSIRYFRSPEFLDHFRDLTFGHIEDLDSFERELNEKAARPEPPPDPVYMAEEHEYQNSPIIGLRAARLPWRTVKLLRDAQEVLFQEIRHLRREIRQASSAIDENSGAEALEPARSLIPKEHRSPPMSLTEAARKLGYRGMDQAVRKQLRSAMKAGTIAYERLSRQSIVFDLRQFPAGTARRPG
jgi:hypothetical protein